MMKSCRAQQDLRAFVFSAGGKAAVYFRRGVLALALRHNRALWNLSRPPGPIRPRAPAASSGRDDVTP